MNVCLVHVVFHCRQDTFQCFVHNDSVVCMIHERIQLFLKGYGALIPSILRDKAVKLY